MCQDTQYTPDSVNTQAENVNKGENSSMEDEFHQGRKGMLQLKAAYFKMIQCNFGGKMSA